MLATSAILSLGAFASTRDGLVKPAQAAPPETASAASREQVAIALHALQTAMLGVPRSLVPGEVGTIEDAIAHFAPAFPNLVREGQAPPARAGAQCPPEMALVANRVCVDRFEASVLEVGADGVMRPHSPYHPLARGKMYAARSVADAVPQAYISGSQAAAACRAARKRLCEPVEWRAACGGKQGFAYPYGKKHQPGACNDRGAASVMVFHSATQKRGWGHAELNDPRLNEYPNTISATGSKYACVNDYGVWDMVGNLHEWTADPNGTFQGGYYLDTTQHGEGCAYRTTAHDFDYRDYSIGFRCCADPK